MAGDSTDICNFSLRILGQAVNAQARVPTGPATIGELLPVLRELTGKISEVAVKQVESEGKSISCRAGCGACCRQIVPVGEAEALALASLVDSLPAGRRERVRQRFHDAIERLSANALLERVRDVKGLVPLSERRSFALEYFKAGVACPFLEDESCSIHPERPLSCREYLVTSPAANCGDPGPGRIEMVPMPGKVSEVLYRFGDGTGKDTHRYVPLVLALEWAEAHRGDAVTRLPGPQLLENFVRQLAG